MWGRGAAGAGGVPGRGSKRPAAHLLQAACGVRRGAGGDRLLFRPPLYSGCIGGGAAYACCQSPASRSGGGRLGAGGGLAAAGTEEATCAAGIAGRGGGAPGGRADGRMALQRREDRRARGGQGGGAGGGAAARAAAAAGGADRTERGRPLPGTPRPGQAGPGRVGQPGARAALQPPGRHASADPGRALHLQLPCWALEGGALPARPRARPLQLRRGTAWTPWSSGTDPPMTAQLVPAEPPELTLWAGLSSGLRDL